MPNLVPACKGSEQHDGKTNLLLHGLSLVLIVLLSSQFVPVMMLVHLNAQTSWSKGLQSLTLQPTRPVHAQCCRSATVRYVLPGSLCFFPFPSQCCSMMTTVREHALFMLRLAGKLCSSCIFTLTCAFESYSFKNLMLHRLE